VDNPGGALRPGMFCRVEISAGEGAAGEAVLAVPDDAVQTVEGGPAVFVPVAGEDDTFAKRAVTVGKPVGGWVPVLSGLKEGEPVVVGGSFILKADLGKSGAAHEH
jgi:cobalt-zinc-cadmium efflux system membrane fusion protein